METLPAVVAKMTDSAWVAMERLTAVWMVNEALMAAGARWKAFFLVVMETLPAVDAK